MAKGYRPVLRDQPFLLPPDMREWLPAEHPVHLVIAVIAGHLDTSGFHEGRRTGGAGAAGYDPDMLLGVLVWAYANGVTSSRRIEQLCGTDVAFRVICGGNLPDHVTIARFRAGFADAAGSLFAEVLGLCARLGMGRLGVIALDGTKIKANASKAANRGQEALEKLAAGTVAAHAAADAAEDELFGGARGGEVPPDAWSPGRRDERIAAALAGLRADRAARQAAGAERASKQAGHLAAAARGTPRRCRPPDGTEVELARVNLERVTAAQQARYQDWQARSAASLARTGRPLRGPRAVPPGRSARVAAAAARLEQARQRQAAREAAPPPQDQRGVRNLTDPDSRLLPVRGGGYVQGYNAQNMVSEDGLIIATQLTASPADATSFTPMLAAAEDAAALITARQPRHPGSKPPGGNPDSGPGNESGPGYRPAGDDGQPLPYHGPIGLLLADAGYLSAASITAPGPPRLIATGKHHQLEKAARDARSHDHDDDSGPGTPAGSGGTGTASGQDQAGPLATMAGLLRTEAGITAYRQRGHIAETPHGNIKHNLRFTQLTMRGKTRASAEWTFTATVHNLLTAISSRHLTSQALAALPG